MTKPVIYVLDSDVFIAAKNAYYAFDICPGFWDSIIRANTQNRVHSIDRIKAELLAGQPEEDLVLWVKRSLPAEFFQSTQSQSVIDAYTEIALWIQRSRQYLDRAKAKFATEADGWLVAYSMVHGTTVVTNEQPRPDSQSRVLLPDLCTQFKVQSQNTFTMLRGMAMKFDLRAHSQ
jgi:hypothetical protein